MEVDERVQSADVEEATHANQDVSTNAVAQLPVLSVQQ
jgi:hypothetical protein